MGSEYDVRRADKQLGQRQKQKGGGKSFVSGPSMDALRSGAAQPSAAQRGSRVDLPDAIRAKFEQSFGTDLSAVKLYRSQAVADAGAEAVTQGNQIAFAPGMLDFTSHGGQALLGHELSHVVSQARGEVHGGGFLKDSALESRADREGALAAAGQTVYASAMPTASLSTASAASAAGPMQASKHSAEEQANMDAEKMLTLRMAQKQNMKLSLGDKWFMRRMEKKGFDANMMNYFQAKKNESAGNVLGRKQAQDEAAVSESGKDFNNAEIFGSYDLSRMNNAYFLMDEMMKRGNKTQVDAWKKQNDTDDQKKWDKKFDDANKIGKAGKKAINAEAEERKKMGADADDWDDLLGWTFREEAAKKKQRVAEEYAALKKK